MQRTRSARRRRTQKKLRSAAFGVLTTGAVTLSLLPATTSVAAADSPVSAWGRDTHYAVPPVKVGTTTPPQNREPQAPGGADAKLLAAFKAKAESPADAAAARQVAAATTTTTIPQGQGAIPWHRISDFRITDALVARVNYSTGNLMLASTSFDMAAVGNQLQLTQTYNSMDSSYGRMARRWWLNYERWLVDSGDKATVYDTSGASVTFTKPSSGSAWTTPAGYSKDLTKNSDGTWTLTDRKSGSKDTYNSNGTLTKVTDKNHGVFTVDQNASGGFKVTDTRSGRWIEIKKTVDKLRWDATDNTGRTVRYDLDGYDNLRAITDTTGKKTQFFYDGSNRVTKIITPENRVTKFTYDVAHRVTSMLRATSADATTGPTYTYAYSNTDANGAGTTTVTDPLGDATKYEHDSDGEVSKVTDPLGHHRSDTYDDNHNVKTATDAMGTGSDGSGGNETTYGWDGRNNPTSAKLPTGATASMSGYQTIAGSDLPGTMTTPDNVKSTYKYDTVGNTTSVAVSGDGGGTRDYVYNKATPTCGGFEGQTCSVEDERDKKTSFTYDDKGNLTKVTPPSPQGATTYTYDDKGRPDTVTDGRGVKLTYTYDDRDRTTKVTGPTATVTYTYDGDGNLTQRVDGTGTQTYQFDPLSRETIRTLQDGSQTELTYTADGNVETYRDPQGTTAYQYDDANRMTTLTAPDGKDTTYTYTNNDVLKTTTYPGGTVRTVTPDNSDRPKQIKVTSPKGTLIDLSYTYSYGASNTDGTKIRTTTDTVAGTKRSFEYNDAGRFSYAAETKGSTSVETWQYCYDAAGNLTSQGTTKGCPRGTTYTYNDASQLITKNGSATGWSYDKAGNETAGASETARTAETYTDFSQLSSITTNGTARAGQYASTDSSERVKLGETVFHNGPVGLSASTTAGVDTGFIRSPQGTLNSMTRSGKSYYYLTDALGSTVALADGSGTKVASYRYSPRGVTTPTENTGVSQPYRFAGTYQDPTDLYHMGARYYDTRTGRFTQNDPSGQEKNPYLYAEGDPVNRIDPTGLYGIDDFAKDIGTIAAGGGSTAAVGSGIGCGVGFFVATLPGCGAGAAVGSAIGGAVGVIGTTITVITLRN
ncbi:RHS repeat-associated core domain-containing protein [Streptomyces sp. HUAS MG91]|uniref:RHS repeat-associated core domain-containing protein n=1 Tax=Streptomyces tabacisoli TaxID=3156398 RepID=A0AAU8IZG3_9ACTN